MNVFAQSSTGRRGRRRDGVAAVEFALCLPVIVLLVLGAIEASTMIFLKQSLTVAAYEGARTAVVPDAETADVITTCEQILADRHVSGATIDVTPAVEDANIGEFMQITVTAPCNDNTILTGRFFRNKLLSGSAEFMKEY